MKEFIRMANKKFLICLFFNVISGGNMLIANELKVELKDYNSTKKNVSISLIITNETQNCIKIPKSYLNLFYEEEKFVVGDWMQLSANGKKSFPHKIIYLKLKTENLNEDEYVSIDSNSQFLMSYNSIQKYYKIPFWIKHMQIQHIGPLGTSNVLMLDF